MTCSVPFTLTAFIAVPDGRFTSTIAAVWMTTLAFLRTALTFMKRRKALNTYCKLLNNFKI